MNQDDFLAGEHPQFERMGAIARAMGQGLFENPMFQEAVSDVACFYDWATRAEAWSRGWRRQDNGRDRAVASLMRVDSW